MIKNIVKTHFFIMFFHLVIPFYSYAMVPNAACTTIPGSMDASFGRSPGLVLTIMEGSSFAAAAALVRQSDNKLVAAGFAFIGSDVNSDFTLIRYLPDGSLDASFGNGGIVTTNFVFNEVDQAFTLVLQPDAKLVAAGFANANNPNFALARYLPNGTLDSSFGNSGKVITSFIEGNSRIRNLLLLPDGNLVAAGEIGVDFALARYTPNGSLDTSFGNGGKVITPFTQGNSVASAVVVQSDGKLVAAGRAGTSFVLVRYNANGSLDTSFGNGGKVITNFISSILSGELLADVIVQSDEKLVIACHTGNDSTADFALARYNPDGTLDTSFGDNGETITDFIQGNSAIQTLILEPNGKLIAAGIANYSPTGLSSTGYAIARYNSNGTLDTTFNPTGGGNILSSNPPGTIMTTFESSVDETLTFNGIYALAFQPIDNTLKLVAAGVAGRDDGLHFSLARYFLEDNANISPLAAAIIAKYC